MLQLIHEDVNTYNPYPLAQGSSFSLWENIPGISWIRSMYHTLILQGLAKLYIYGPSMGAIGGWQGQTPQGICSHLTPSSEEFWLRNPEECSHLITRQFYSWIVLFEVVLYFLIIFKVILWLTKSCVQLVFSTSSSK